MIKEEESIKKHHHKKHHSKSKKRARNIIISIFVILLVAVGGYGFWVYSAAKGSLDSSYKSAGEKQAAGSVVANKQPLNVLLLGVDTGDFGRDYQGRSDTMIIATVNPDKKRTTLTSIPRDTMAELIGTTDFDFERINAAYAKGGAEMALKSISELVSVPLEYYVTVNMGGLQKIVDAVGGVDISPTLSFEYGGYSFKPGKVKMDGKKALAYSRMRYDDPKGDYGRQERQQQVIMSVVKAAISTRSITNFQDVLKAISSNMTTNLSFDDMVEIFKDYRGYGKTIKQDHLQGLGAMWGEAMIQIAPTTELQRISDNLRAESGLDRKKVNNQVTWQNELNVKKNGFKFDSNTSRQDFEVYPPNTTIDTQ